MNDTIRKPGIREFLQNEHDLKVGNDVDAAANEALNELLAKAAERDGQTSGAPSKRATCSCRVAGRFSFCGIL
jgi:hypothetical protein